MAKEPEKKPRWYQLIAQAYRTTAPHDKWLLPLIIGVPVVIIGASVVLGLVIGNTIGLVYSIIIGVLVASLAGLYTLTRRFEKSMFERMEGQPGASLSVAQSIRRGWTFGDDPVSIDPKGRGVVFQGVGKPGVTLLIEGGNAARKQVDAAKRRIAKLVPGVPVRMIYVGTGEGQVPLKSLTRKIRSGKKVLSRREREVVVSRLRAMGGARLPIPKGVDPMRARPDRKGMRGR